MNGDLSNPYLDENFFDYDEVPNGENLCFDKSPHSTDNMCQAMFTPAPWRSTTQKCVFYECRNSGRGCSHANFYTGECSNSEAIADKDSLKAVWSL